MENAIQSVVFRKAKIADVSAIQELVNNYAAQGKMLAKARITICENLREYVIAVKDEQLIGVAGLHILWDDLAEVRSVAVHPEYTNLGIGAELVKRLEAEARELGLEKVFVLTYQEAFFSELGFKLIKQSDLPQKLPGFYVGTFEFGNFFCGNVCNQCV